MQHIKLYVLLLAAFAVGIPGSCTQELDLDEETLLLLEKQDKLEKLDELYDLAFIDPSKAQEDYNLFYTNELLTETQNFLVDNDVRMRSTFTDLAIRLNIDFEKTKVASLPESLFELYQVKFENVMFNRSLLGEIPQQLRRGDKLTKFEAKVEEVTAFFDTKISEKKNESPVDQNLIGKQWKVSKWATTPEWKTYIINFDFTLKSGGSMDIDEFYFFPLYDQEADYTGSIIIENESTNSTTYKVDIASILLSPEEYAAYDDKLFFYFHLEADPNSDNFKFNREWCFEYEYKVEGNTLTLSTPRVMRFMHPFLYIGGYGRPYYERLYPEVLREPIILITD